MPKEPSGVNAWQELHDLLEALQADNHYSEEMLNALTALNQQVETLCTENENGFAPPLTKEGREELLKLYAAAVIHVKDARDASIRSNRAADSSQPSAAKGYEAVLSHLYDLLALDVTTLLSAPADGTKPLPELMENARTIVAGSGGLTPSTVGANSSSRLAVSYEQDGREIQGFYTMRRIHKGFDTAEFERLLAKTGLADHAYIPYLIKAARVLSRSDKNATQSKLKDYLYESTERYLRSDRRLPTSEVSSFLEKLEDLLYRPEVHHSRELEVYLRETSNENFQYTQLVKAEKGSDISGRNVAMSRMSELLGVPHIIAQSRFMNLTDKNGKENVRGVFMENAKGRTLSSLKPGDLNLDETGNFKVSPNALKNIAEMQMLDYICQNVDRHANNFLYQFSEDGTTLLGIQGIDNDQSFGTIVRGDKETGFRLVQDNKVTFSKDTPLDNLKVIPQSMADHLTALHPQMLRCALRDTGLKRKEIDAAITRLTKVQDRINKKTIMVVKDEEWQALSLHSLARMSGRSLFSRVNDLNRNIENELLDHQRQPESSPLTFTKLSIINGFDSHTMEMRRQEAVQFAVRIRDSQKEIFGSGSPEFKRLHEAVKAYQKVAATARKKNTIENRQALLPALDAMAKAAQDYLNKKGAHSGNRKTQKRIDIANQVKDYVANTRSKLKQAEEARMEQERTELQKANKELAVADKMYQALLNSRRQTDPQKADALEKMQDKALSILMKSTQLAEAKAHPEATEERLAELTAQAIQEHNRKMLPHPQENRPQQNQPQRGEIEQPHIPLPG